MLRWLIKLFYGGVSAEFVSEFDMAESVQRLTAVVNLKEQNTSVPVIAVGTVGEKYVSLERINPTFRNGWKPFFRGDFRRVGDKIVLQGGFSTLLRVKINTSILLFGAIYVSFLEIRDLINENSEIHEITLAPIALLVIVVTSTWIGRHFGSKDIPLLSKLIQEALSKHAVDEMNFSLPIERRPDFMLGWQHVKNIRFMVLAIGLSQILGAAYFWFSSVLEDEFLNIWTGGSIASSFGFLIGCLIQKYGQANSLKDNSAIVKYLGLGSLLLTTAGSYFLLSKLGFIH
jgi:hypothetical protein